MRLFCDNEEITVESADELEQAIIQRRDTCDEYLLKDEDSGTNLNAERIFFGYDDWAYVISYQINNVEGYQTADLTDIAEQENIELDDISLVTRIFSLFCKRDDKWNKLCLWDEISFRQTLKNITWIIVAMVVLVFLFSISPIIGEYIADLF